MRSGARPRAPTDEGQVEQSEAVKVSAFASRKNACVAMWCCSMTLHHAGSCLSGPTCLELLQYSRTAPGIPTRTPLAVKCKGPAGRTQAQLAVHGARLACEV